MPIPDWMTRLFATIDAGAFDEFAEYIADDATFRYGSLPAVFGREMIRQAAEQAVAPFRSVRHKLIDHWERDDASVVQGEVTYELPGGVSHTLPFVNVFRMRDGLIASYLIYIDPTPLTAGAI